MKQSNLDFLFSLGNFGIKLGLENMKNLMDALGHPEKHPRIIHCAGTNGKGSTLATLERLLLDSGFSVGMTTSPHLVKLNERIRVNGVSVSDSELEELFLQISSVCEMDVSNPESAETWKIPATFFEFVITMALVCFQQNQVDYILLETGLGGRLDASNIVPKPLIQILTPISKDHEAFLGDTLEKIAMEKLGIIKGNRPTIVSAQDDSLRNLIQGQCALKDSKTAFYPDDFSIRKEGESLEYTGLSRNVRLSGLGLKGNHQLENTASALAAYESVVAGESQLSDEDLRSSLKQVSWSGRLELIKGTPDILVDGAHNEAGWQVLVDYILEHHAKDNILFAVNWMVDKKIPDVFDQLGFNENVFLPLENPYHRAATGEQVSAFLDSRKLKKLPPMSLETFTGALESDFKDYDLIVVAGSLYLIGNFYSQLKSVET